MTEGGNSWRILGSLSRMALATATALPPAWRKTATTTVDAGDPYSRDQNRMLMRSSCTPSIAVATSRR